MTLVQTGRPRARIHRSDPDIVALVVPGSAGIQAEFDLSSLRAPDLAGPMRSIESLVGSHAKHGMEAPGS